MVQPNAPAQMYQLLQINPPIWRRLRLRSDSSVATLHELFQIAFDWSDRSFPPVAPIMERVP